MTLGEAILTLCLVVFVVMVGCASLSAFYAGFARDEGPDDPPPTPGEGRD